MITGIFNAVRGNQTLGRNFEVFMDRTANTLLVNLRKYTPKRSGLAAKSWRKTKSVGKTYNLSNRQPYVPRLDKGYSKKAPNGFFTPASRETTRTNKGRFFK